MNDYLFQPGDGKQPLVDVVIPALNEQETIGAVVSTFRQSPHIGKVIVVSDLSKDRTAPIARKAGALVVKGPGQGKGQAMMRGLREVQTHRVIFADADLYGLSVNHVKALAAPAFGMLVGFRDKGRFNFAQVAATLPPIAGERSLPTRFVRSLKLDGYGAEMQINAAVARNNMRAYHFIMRGVKGEFRAGPLRMIDIAPHMRPELMSYGGLVKWLAPVALARLAFRRGAYGLCSCHRLSGRTFLGENYCLGISDEPTSRTFYRLGSPTHYRRLHRFLSQRS